jgi:hypothetical protein
MNRGRLRSAPVRLAATTANSLESTHVGRVAAVGPRRKLNNK